MYLDRLLRRGLAADGSGETGSDALHELLSDLYLIPAKGGVLAGAARAFPSNTAYTAMLSVWHRENA